MADDETPENAWKPWLARIAASRKRKDDLVSLWQKNVDKRRGKSSETNASTTTVSINIDWSVTKAKIAGLYSQTPEIRLSPRYPDFAQAVPIFGQELNDTITDISVGSTIEEALADVVNASGIGAVLVTCDKRTETKQVPEIDPATLPPDVQQAVMTGQFQIPMVPVETVADLQYRTDRISPADLLIPSDFTGSNYDHARWLGHEDRMTWAQAQSALGLTEEQKDDVLGTDTRTKTSQSLSTDSTKFKDTEVVNYTQIFYWRHYYHADETNFHALQRLVFVDGLDEPVVNEPYQVQKRLEDGRLVGVTKNPIRVLTLTYISDDSLPPSDCTIIRFQVDELEASRDAMVQQRKHSIPIRWGDTNRLSANARAKIDQGDFQSFIWTNGPGDRAVGEVARASFPQEKFEFDKIIKGDITEMVQVGTNQSGNFAPGERSASEAKIIQQNFQTRVGQEQDKVQKFFLGIAEVLAGHLALYGTFDLPDQLGEMREQMANAFTYSVRVDSTVRLNAEQRIEQLTRALNLTAQSGYVNPKEIISEIWELSGVDPAKVVINPQPKAPEPVKISISKAEDIINPVMLGALFATGQAPSPEHMAAALKLLTEAMQGAVPIVPPSQPTDGPPAEVETPGIRNEGWETMPRVERRAEDGGA
jgi:hypothetical protein